jgi:hypothetical protein
VEVHPGVTSTYNVLFAQALFAYKSITIWYSKRATEWGRQPHGSVRVAEHPVPNRSQHGIKKERCEGGMWRD